MSSFSAEGGGGRRERRRRRRKGKGKAADPDAAAADPDAADPAAHAPGDDDPAAATVATVLARLEPSLVDYVTQIVADVELPASGDAAALAGELADAVGPVLVSASFCAEGAPVAAVCARLAAVLLRDARAADEAKAFAAAAQAAARADGAGPRGYDDLLDNAEHDALVRQVVMGEEKDTDWKHCYENTMDDFLDKNSRASKQRARREAKERERIAELRLKVEAAARAVAEREEQAVRDLPSRLEGSASARNDLILDNVTIASPAGKVLLEGGQIKLVRGRKYGLIGRNGIGKTTMLRAMAQREIPGFPDDLRVLHVSQEISGGKLTVVNTVVQGDYELARAKAREAALLAHKNADPGELSAVYDLLEALEAKTAETRACAILAGLQFTPDMLHVPTSSLSGGWRMRVALARALYLRPDLLLLDEPTNHLDLEACLWLEQYLNEYEDSLVIVSHDRRFLNAVATDIMHMHHGKLEYYRGDYETFEKASLEAARRQHKAFAAQQKKREHMQAFVDKFRYNAKRAAMAQSRIKALARMEVLEDVETDPTFRFEFPDPGTLDPPIVAVNDITFRYSKATPIILRRANFGLDLQSRVAIVGPNGAGKSTLLKLITGELRADSGYVSRNGKLKIGVFTQHHGDQLDLALSAVRNMQIAFPNDNLEGLAGEERVRKHLGRFGVVAELASKPVAMMSGGQKSRVSFALITWRKPHILIMDEPTNHLDLETIDALSMACSMFAGGVVVVSHDQAFVEACCEEIWEVCDRKVKVLDGGLDEYRANFIKKMKADAKKRAKAGGGGGGGASKQ